MPTTRISSDLEMHYLIDDFTDPWRKAEAVLLLHGNAESSKAWFGWVPHLARHFRVVRPDMRGFGDSTPMPRDFPWSLDLIIDDYLSLMKTLDLERIHLVGAKIGGFIARRFAARCPERVRTLTLVGSPTPHREVAAMISTRMDELEEHGIEHWARRTMAGRLGSRFPPEGVEWWIKMMGLTAVSTDVGFLPVISNLDTWQDLPRIACPTLVIASEGSTSSSVEQVRAWQQKIPNSRLLVLPGDSFHVGASDADRCAEETLAFISREDAATH